MRTTALASGVSGLQTDRGSFCHTRVAPPQTPPEHHRSPRGFLSHSSSNSRRRAHGRCWVAAGSGARGDREAGRRGQAGGLGAGKRARLLTCFCSSLSPLIASSTANSEWARWETRRASGDSGGVRSLQLVARAPRSQAAVAISDFTGARAQGEVNPPHGLHQSRASLPPPMGEGDGSPAAYHSPLPLKGARPSTETRANQR